jgi:hypothetical protein
MAPDSMAIIQASPVKYMSENIPYRFRQNTDFRYLTGFPEQDAVLVLQRSTSAVDTTLFVLPKTPYDEIWNGPRIGPSGAETLFGVSSAHHLRLLQSTCPSLLLLLFHGLQ